MKKLIISAFMLLFVVSFSAQTNTNSFDQLSQLSNNISSKKTQVSYSYDEVGNRIGMIITNNPTTDLGMSNSKLGVKLYPNPTSESFCISGFENNATLRLTDISGKVILSKQVSDNEIIPISSLPKGIYIVELITKKGVIEKKLLKK